MPKDPKEVFHSVSIPVSTARLMDLLVGAFEGGSNYWYRKMTFVLAPGLEFKDFRVGGEHAIKDWEDFPLYVIPFHEGCSLTMFADGHKREGNKPFVLDADAMVRGLDLMAKDYQKHFSDMINEEDDATTADVFLQLSVFGELIFG